MSFEISGGLHNLSQNTLRLINKFEKGILSFMENLIADLIQFFSAIAKFLLLQGRLGTRLCVHLKFPYFLGRLTTREVPRTFSL